MNNNYLQEAFKRLGLLEAEDEENNGFSISDSNTPDELNSFVNDDSITQFSVLDPEALSDEEMEDSYDGDIILSCSACGTLISKHKEDILKDDGLGYYDVGVECPACHSSAGYTMMGKVFGSGKEEPEETEPVEVEVNDVEEIEEPTEEDEKSKFESFRQRVKKHLSESTIKEDFEYRVHFDDDAQNTDETFDSKEKAIQYAKEHKDQDPVVYEYDPETDEERVWAFGFKDDDEDEDDTDLEGNSYKEYVKKNKKEINLIKNKFKQYNFEITDAYGEDVWHLYSGDETLGKPVEIAINIYLAGDYDPSDNSYTVLDGDGNEYHYNTLDELIKSVESMFKKSERIGEATEKFPDPKKHKEVKEVNGIKIYHCNDCDKYAAMVKGEKIKKDTLEEIEDAIKSKDESLSEAVEINATGEDSVNVTKNDDGSLDVNVGKVDTAVDGESSIVPLTDDELSEIDANQPEEDELGGDELGDTEEPAEGETEEPAEEPETEDEEEIDLSDIEEESFDYLGKSYLKKIYENVNDYKTTDIKEENNKLFVEGLITFNSGKQKKTTFTFNPLGIAKSGRLVFEGFNPSFGKSSKMFTLKGKHNQGTFIPESMTYNYSIDKLNESTGKTTKLRISGRVHK